MSYTFVFLVKDDTACSIQAEFFPYILQHPASPPEGVNFENSFLSAPLETPQK